MQLQIGLQANYLHQGSRSPKQILDELDKLFRPNKEITIIDLTGEDKRGESTTGALAAKKKESDKPNIRVITAADKRGQFTTGVIGSKQQESDNPDVRIMSQPNSKESMAAANGAVDWSKVTGLLTERTASNVWLPVDGGRGFVGATTMDAAKQAQLDFMSKHQLPSIHTDFPSIESVSDRMDKTADGPMPVNSTTSHTQSEPRFPGGHTIFSSVEPAVGKMDKMSEKMEKMPDKMEKMPDKSKTLARITSLSNAGAQRPSTRSSLPSVASAFNRMDQMPEKPNPANRSVSYMTTKPQLSSTHSTFPTFDNLMQVPDYSKSAYRTASHMELEPQHFNVAPNVPKKRTAEYMENSMQVAYGGQESASHTTTHKAKKPLLSKDDTLHPAKKRAANGGKKAAGMQEPPSHESLLWARKNSKSLEGLLSGIIAERMAGMGSLLSIEPGVNVEKFFFKVQEAFYALGRTNLNVGDEMVVPFVLAKLVKKRRDILEALKRDGVSLSGIGFHELVKLCVDVDKRESGVMRSGGVSKGAYGEGSGGMGVE